jgi:hypothetical protein
MLTVTRAEVYETAEGSGVLEVAMMTNEGIKQYTIGVWDAWLLQGMLETEIGPYIIRAIAESKLAHLAPTVMEPWLLSEAA